ncbi:MAG: hypothetical protein H6741_21495 [Alphaproteobacteria bacterium]|nr:hypothetical protein [Alphaproteobacteria bacterium]
MAPLLLVTLAQAPLGLAPTPQELQSALAELERRLTWADALGEAVASLHNAYAQGGPPGAKRPCEDARSAALAAAAQPFGEAYRDVLQAARAQHLRVERLLDAPTLAPLVQGQLADEIVELERRLDAQEARHAELAAWHQTSISPMLQRCTPELGASEGAPGDRAVRVDVGPIAVLVLEGGEPYPTGQHVHGLVWLVPPEACWAPVGESCAPAPVAPGAVLGPAAAQGAEE